MSVGNLQVPSIILLVFCLTAPDKDGSLALVCSMEHRYGKRKKSSKERRREREKDKTTILTFSCGILSAGE